MSIHDAAEVMSIPIEECFEYCLKRLEKPESVSFELKLVAEDALKTALKTLTKVAAAGPRESSDAKFDDDGNMTSKVTYSDADVEAAKALAKLAIDSLKMGFQKSVSIGVQGNGKARALVQLDLWDGPGAWDLKKPGS